MLSIKSDLTPSEKQKLSGLQGRQLYHLQEATNKRIREQHPYLEQNPLVKCECNSLGGYWPVRLGPVEFDGGGALDQKINSQAQQQWGKVKAALSTQRDDEAKEMLYQIVLQAFQDTLAQISSTSSGASGSGASGSGTSANSGGTGAP